MLDEEEKEKEKAGGGFPSLDHSNSPIISAPHDYAPLQCWSSDHCALLKICEHTVCSPLVRRRSMPFHDKISNPRKLKKAIGMLTWPLKEKAAQ